MSFRATSLVRLALLLVLVMTASQRIVSAQDDGDDEFFVMSAVAAFCTEGLPAPQQGCTPWDGLVVTVTSDSEFSTSCTTASDGGSSVASCSINPPYGITITASIDASSIPAGYALSSATGLVQTIEVPDSEPDGIFPGPIFFLYPLADETPVEPDPEPESPPTSNGEVTGLPNTGAGSTDSNRAISSSFMLTVLGLAVLGVMTGMRKTRRA